LSEDITDAANPPVVPTADAAFPVVGVGASAGGLAAFEAFFDGLPADVDPGMAFVLVQHLAPDHDSLLSELLGHRTRLTVVEATDGVHVRPDVVYAIPPNRDIALRGGALHLLDPAAPRGLRLPIDSFFRSLAEDQGARAVCVVLSGAGSDGTEGARAVKTAGGLVVVQRPDTAAFDPMPRSVIAAGLADLVLPPGEMIPRLLDDAALPRRERRSVDAPVGAAVAASLPALLALLRQGTAHDFSQYKTSTVGRRVERRMAANHIAAPEDYRRFCRQSPAELDALFRDLLIGVTQFFRDPEEFATLEGAVMPRLFARRAPGAAVRAWVPACSTGEEPYSIAMLMREQIEAAEFDARAQVFATDLDPRAVAFARAGRYPASVGDDLTPERLARFFHRTDSGALRVEKRLRDLVIFSEQDVLKDPPFSRLDLISCRNLLIYLSPEAQGRLLRLFHYALVPGGFLFLGNSESLGDVGDRFVAVDRHARLFQRRDGAVDYRGATALPATAAPPALPARAGPAPTEDPMPLREITERALLQYVQAAAALVDGRGDIRYLHGRTGRYLEPSPGVPGVNIMEMAREGLRPPLTVALHRAATQREPQSHPALQVKTNGGFSAVDLTVRPLSPTATGVDEALFLVVLEEARPAAAAVAVAPTELAASDVDARVVALTEQLRAKGEYLRSSVEELETANEELRSTNEEMQSINEELQSTNEELETSKEELQSVNEELATVNHELQSKVADLARTTNDMNNLFASAEIGTVFVDHDLVIQRFTPAVTKVINLIATDVGRPVGHMASNLVGYDTLVDDVRAVLDSLVPREIEVQTRAGAWFLLRVRPYRTVDNVIEGAVITFVDITELKRAQTLAREGETERHLAAVVRDATDAVMMLDPAGRILAWNPAAVRLYGWSEAEALQQNIRDITAEEDRAEAVANIQRLSRSEALVSGATQRIVRGGGFVPVWLMATALLDEAHEVYAYATTERPRTAP
jgi:two-component system, chemotaxis family, CheB/CheR fusion protein